MSTGDLILIGTMREGVIARMRDNKREAEMIATIEDWRLYMDGQDLGEVNNLGEARELIKRRTMQ